MDLSQRMKAARKHAGLTQRQLAEATNVEQPLISQLETGKTLKSAHIAQMARVCGVNAIWLASGYGEMLDAPASTANEQQPGDFDDDRYAHIKQTTARGAAGNGHENPHVEIRGTLAFKKSWLSFKGLKEKHLEVIYAHGNSMAPTIFDGDVLLIDKSCRNPIDNQVFALNSATNGAIVKRLKRDVHGRWALISDNLDKRTYPDQWLADSEGNEMTIAGRVVWRGGDI